MIPCVQFIKYISNIVCDSVICQWSFSLIDWIAHIYTVRAIHVSSELVWKGKYVHDSKQRD